MILSLAAAMSSGGLPQNTTSSATFDPSSLDPWLDPYPDLPGVNSSSAVPVRTSTSDLDLRPLTSPQDVSPWDVALCVTGTLISCENALVIAVLFYTPTLRAPMFILIGSLAFADLLAGLGLILNFVFIYLVKGDVVTLVSTGILIVAFSASILNILAITVDRYLSLYNALTYHTERTVLFTYLVIGLIWLVGLILGVLPALGWNCLDDETTCSVCRPVTKSNAVALAVFFLLVFAVMMQLYLQICRIAFRHAQQIAVQHQFIAISTTKGVQTLSVILCAFAMCWLPFAMYSIVADSSYPIIYTYATVLPAACNSVINPIIYAFRNPDIQKGLWLACCGCVPSNLSLRPRARTSSDV
ncbi:G-protein coupled receptor 12 [Salvelinus fontinalis]|uniref:G-protein coupled receptor 12 n=1 Tax=Salvelinus namaycush TaxID=8040 RepID=A0A8U0QXT2_SALNM|nr:G-protein coupled receptor 12 [Salvelinus namaycush]XP_055794529.1 G-protein coupled receptor 12 [Salvelinus fontinalis]XP_055794530.1 G-protein coupled receptor 12 [Salvelinus fontinalis]